MFSTYGNEIFPPGISELAMNRICKFLVRIRDEWQQLNHFFSKKVHRELVMGNWLCCDTCTKYFPDENVMALHNSHTHNKVVKVDQGLDDPSQMDDLDGDTSIKLVRNL